MSMTPCTRFALAFFLPVVFLLAGLTVALASPNRTDLTELSGEMLDWIGENTEYDTDIPPPTFSYHSHAELVYLRHGTRKMGGPPIYGLYRGGRVFLREGFELPGDEHVLLHELVHHVQLYNGAEFACGAAREREAYELQLAYVEETGRGEKPDLMWVHVHRCYRP